MPGTRYLVVEGEADKVFFNALLRKIGIKGVEICPPLTLGGEANGRENAIDLLPNLLKQMHDGRVTHLGLVLDADYKSKGLGANQAFKRVSDIGAQNGYVVPSPWPAGATKYVFSHNNGLPDFGLWVMPDCQAEGMIEHLVYATATDQQRPLLIKAEGVVSALNPTLFDANRHKMRAAVYSWLSWQKMPGKALASVIGDDLVDLSKPPLDQCVVWLKSVFR